MERTEKAIIPREKERRDLLLHLLVTALAAGALVAAGHWFGSRRGRCVGGDKRKPKSGADNGGDKVEGLNTRTSNCAQPMSLAELRLRRLKAAEARCSSRNGPSAVKLTPLGRILRLAERADKLEEDTHKLLKKEARVLDSFEENAVNQEQVRLLELLTQLQIEVDAVPADESVRPQRKHQTKRIQALITSLDQLEHHDTSAGILVPEAGSNLKI